MFCSWFFFLFFFSVFFCTSVRPCSPPPPSPSPSPPPSLSLYMFCFFSLCLFVCLSKFVFVRLICCCCYMCVCIPVPWHVNRFTSISSLLRTVRSIWHTGSRTSSVDLWLARAQTESESPQLWPLGIPIQIVSVCYYHSWHGSVQVRELGWSNQEKARKNNHSMIGRTVCLTPDVSSSRSLLCVRR